jgi:4-methylaminobutanoate oxidase (formaldehyde-forming)
VPGFWLAAGLSHTGFGAGGAIGHILAEWLVNGEPPYDVTELSARRFGPVYEDRAYAAERARESYKYYYTLRYPHDENEWARSRRLGPLDERLAESGAVFGEKNGWERVNYFEPGAPGRRAGADQRRWSWGRPAFFERVGEEHRAVRERAALFDFTSFGKLDVSGPGARALLQRLADNDIDRPVGSVVYTQFLNPRGGIESDLTVTRWAENRFRVTTGSNFVASDLGWIRMHQPVDGTVDVRDVTDEFACIGLWGPEARRVLEAVTSSDVSNRGFPYMSAREIDVAGVRVWAQRVTYVGELGWECYVRNDHAVGVWDALLGAARSASGPRDTRRWTHSGSRRAIATGAPTSRRRRTRTRPVSASASGSERVNSSGARRCSASRRTAVRGSSAPSRSPHRSRTTRTCMAERRCTRAGRSGGGSEAEAGATRWESISATSTCPSI